MAKFLSFALFSRNLQVLSERSAFLLANTTNACTDNYHHNGIIYIWLHSTIIIILSLTGELIAATFLVEVPPSSGLAELWTHSVRIKWVIPFGMHSNVLSLSRRHILKASSTKNQEEKRGPSSWPIFLIFHRILKVCLELTICSSFTFEKLSVEDSKSYFKA